VTFDDAYSDLLTDAYPVLAQRDIPSVVFVVADRIGQTNEWDSSSGAGGLALLDEDALRSLADRGVAIGSHGATHRRLVELESSELDRELQGSATRLASLVGSRPTALSYPYGVWSPEVRDAVAAAGYALAFTVRPGVVRRGEDRYALPRVEVLASDTPGILRLKLLTAGWPEPIRRRLLEFVRRSRR
jgi:peptidoglycan/xylan/chitin deacetylase (PgdA/CDA1 family)